MYSLSSTTFGILFLFCLIFSHAHASDDEPLFYHALSLCEFGMLENTVETLRPKEWLLNDSSKIRTNNFQNLQLKYQDYGTERPVTRMGPFLISQSATRTTGPNGPGIGFPVCRYLEDPHQNSALGIQTHPTSTRLIFSSEETVTYTLSVDTGQSKTAQSCILTYQNPEAPSQGIVDYNIVGNVFHDLKYHDLTPVLFGDEEVCLQAITVFSEAYPDGVTFSAAHPSTPFPLPSGHKFRLEILHLPTQQKQSWLLYLQPSNTDSSTYPEEVFWPNFKGEGPCLLKGETPFTGFIRVAMIQTNPIPTLPEPQVNAYEVEAWAEALGTQTIGATPAALYMLWPKAFTHWAKDKILLNQCAPLYPPTLRDFSLSIPVIARADLDGPELCRAFQKLVEAYSAGPQTPNPFDETTNPFLLYWNLLLAKYFGKEMDHYQEDHKTSSDYWVYATPESAELCYDTHRDVIPVNAELVIGKKQHGWTYTTQRRLESEQEGPLIVFPGYKTLHSTFSHLEGLMLYDAAKGPLYTTVGRDNRVCFQESSLPAFLKQGFFPNTLSKHLSISEKWQLVEYLKQTLKSGALPATLPALISSPDAYVNGKVLFQTALTLLYGSYVMEKIQGYSQVEVYTKMRKLTDSIKRMLEKWLYAFQIQERVIKGSYYPFPFARKMVRTIFRCACVTSCIGMQLNDVNEYEIMFLIDCQLKETACKQQFIEDS